MDPPALALSVGLLWLCLPHANLVAGVSAWREELGGLGSPHTAPFEAAVPAPPPTRSPHITDPTCAPQRATPATKRGHPVAGQRLHSVASPPTPSIPALY